MNKPTDYENQKKKKRELEQELFTLKLVNEKLSLLSATIDQITEGIAFVDLKGEVLFLNPAFATMHGYVVDEVTGKNLSIFHSEEQMLAVNNANKQIMETGQFSGEIWHLKRNGKPFLARMNNSLVYDQDGNPMGIIGNMHDVTEHKLAEDKLIASKTLLDRSQEIAHVGSWSFDLKQDKLFWSDEVFRIFGFSPQEFEPTYGILLESIHPDDRELVDHAFQASIKEKKPYDVIHRIIRPDGEVRVVQEKSDNIIDESGEIIQSYGMIHDITERSLANKELRKRETKLSSIFRAAPAGIGVVVDRKITEVNERFCEMMGYTKVEILGKSARIMYPSDEEYEFVGREKYRQISEQGTGTVETYLQRKDGTLVNVLLSSTPLDLDNLSSGVTFTATNITGIKDTESKLRQSENKFRSMMDSMSDPVYICSDDYRVEYMNSAMIKRTGWDAKGEFCYKTLHDFDRPCPWCKGKDEFHGKYFESDIVSPKDHHSYHVSHSPILNEDGSISNMTIFRDTTEFKKMEAQFYQAQKMEAIGTLAGGVAHDFNNILTVIRGHAQLGMIQTTEENPLWNDLVEIEAAGDRASKLTRQLLAFSRKQVIKPEMILINHLINDLGKMLKRLVGEDVNLKTDFDEKLSPILADPGQLEQIIVNLVVNAADATKDQILGFSRNITISVFEELLDNVFVESHAGSNLGWHLVLEISYNGCGIPQEVVEHIFEPFYTTKEIGKGTGLGLSTVYGIVKQNNASIYVESESNQGTTFKIYWPCAKKDAPKVIKPKELESVSGGNEVILLVEDEKSTRHLAQKILQQAGYTVIEAENGLDALEKAKDLQGTIDLVFSDVVMPVMGGKELSENLSSIYPQIKFLFTSGYLSDRVNRDDEIFNDEGFIDKPYDVPELLKKIRQLLDDRKV